MIRCKFAVSVVALLCLLVEPPTPAVELALDGEPLGELIVPSGNG